MDTINFSTLSSCEIKQLATLLTNIQNQTQLPNIDKMAAAKLFIALKK